MKKNVLCLLAVLAFVSCSARETDPTPAQTQTPAPTPPPTPPPTPTPPPDTKLAEAEELAQVTSEMVVRAAQFREAIGYGDPDFRSGVYAFDSRAAAAFNDRPQVMAARMALLGFTDVYLGRRPISTERKAWVETFVETASRFGMKVHSILISNLDLLVKDDRIHQNVGELQTYNNSVPANKRFVGISSDLEPHTAKNDGRDLPAGLTMYWGTEGPGNANDLLLKRTVEVMKLTRAEIGTGLWLGEAVNYGFQERFDDGRTLNGSTAQFLEHCNQVIVMAYNKDRDRIWSMSEPSLVSAKNAEKPRSVSICVKTSLDTDGGGASTSLLPAGWDAMIADIKYIMEKGKAYDSFRGVDAFEYLGLDTMWDGTAP